MWMLLAIIVPVVILLGLYFYKFFKRMFETFGANTKNKLVKIGIAIGSYGLAMSSIYIFGFTPIIVFHLVLFIPLVQLINFIIKRIAKKKYEDGFHVWKKIYGSGAIPILMTIVMILFGYWNLHHVVETQFTVYTQKDIREEGYRVVFIADVHFGVSLDYEQMLEKCEEISNTNPDIVVLGGDIVDNSTTSKEMRSVFKALGTIESEYGVYYIYGNHDRTMSVLASDFTDEELVKAITENGITILQDDVVPINDDLVLIGREDASRERNEEGRMTVGELLKDVNQDAFLLMLDHQPNEYKENGKEGTDLILSGHTHGGQFFPLNWIYEIIKFDDGVYGHYWINDDSQAIVTGGFADWNYPVKTAVPAEYLVVDIKGE